MARRKRRGVSLGTVTMLTLTALVLVGFFALLPSFTGNQDIRIDAAELAVAMDHSISQLASTTTEMLENLPRTTALPPHSLPVATAVPGIAAPALQITAAPIVTVPPKLSFSLCAAGSIEMNASMRKTLTYEDTYHFEILTDQLTGKLDADLSIATLEHTISESSKVTDVNMPAELLSALQSAGVNLLNIGHENIFNSGVSGLDETLEAVRSADMTPFGAHASVRDVPVLLELNGIRVAVLHYLDEVSSTGRKQADEETIAASVNLIDPDRIMSDIRAARESGAQVVVLSLCWGRNGASSPTDDQAAQAQAFADAGADIILGTGTGVLQPVRVLSADRGDQKYHPVLCAYSLGNLFSHDRESRTTLSSILLKAKVVYDSASGTVAFDDLTYLPTYAWRGKENNRTLVRILLNDNESYPEFVNKDQKSVMQRSYKLVTDVMADTGIPMAQ